MGVVKVPALTDYWSKSKLFSFELPRIVMPRNRFETLLRFWHFAKNEDAVPGNRIHNIEKIFDKFVENFNKAHISEETVCIDETMIPFRGRLCFCQYIPSKRHRYGVKLYKLYVECSIYVGRDQVENKAIPASRNVVLSTKRSPE